uniref:(northern house mosquito) hypothetical protein n=1 Tax=Culex pipiens TaxID=7175 RepID=A0A8D8KZ42_CULPI
MRGCCSKLVSFWVVKPFLWYQIDSTGSATAILGRSLVLVPRRFTQTSRRWFPASRPPPPTNHSAAEACPRSDSSGQMYQMASSGRCLPKITLFGVGQVVFDWRRLP